MALTACGITSSPERTTEKFFSAVKSGDIDKSIECFILVSIKKLEKLFIAPKARLRLHETV